MGKMKQPRYFDLFFQSNLGKFITLRFLKAMKNAEYVHILAVINDAKNDTIRISSEIIQDGSESNIDDCVEKFRFSRLKDISILYAHNANWQEKKKIRLDHLKEVRQCF